MKAVMKLNPQSGFNLKEIPVPELGPDDALVKIVATSICGTDVHIYDWDEWSQHRIHPPQVTGHEMGGEVIALGKNAASLNVGDIVSSETHIFDDTCFQCKLGNRHICENVKLLGIDTNGVWAEYAVVPARNLWKNAPDFPREYISVQEPFGNAVHTIFQGKKRVEGKNILISGCGPIGLCAIGICKASGAKKVYASDINEYRLKLAEKMGADRILNALHEDVVKEIKQETRRGADVFLEMSGSSQAFVSGFKALRDGGRASILGIYSKPFEFNFSEQLVFKGCTVFGINGRIIWDDWKTTAEMISSQKVDLKPLVTHEFKLEKFDKAMQLMKSGNCGKVLLKP